MSKRKKLLLIVVALMVFLLSIMLGYTFSKYINSQDVSSSTATAAWSFDGSLSNTGDTTTKSISLSNTVSKDSIVTGRIAPGTSGSFNIILDANGSEVDVDYDVFLKGEENNKPANLYFTSDDVIDSKDSNHQYIKYYSLAELLAVKSQNHRSNMSGTIDKDNNTSPKVITVNWEWPYESTRDGYSLEELDALDTNDSGITDYTFTLNIVGRQAN